MYRIFAFQLVAPTDIIYSMFDYNPDMPITLNHEGDHYKGLYAWSDKKKYKKRFISERNMKYFIPGYIDFETEEEYKKFMDEYRDLKLHDAEVQTFYENDKSIDAGSILLCLTEFEHNLFYTPSTIQDVLLYKLVYSLDDYLQGADILLSILKDRYTNIGIIEYLRNLSEHLDDYECLFDGYGLFYIDYHELNVLKIFMSIHGVLFNSNVYKGDIYENL